MSEMERVVELAKRAAIRGRLHTIHPYCYLCHKRIWTRRRATIDHVIPPHRGGAENIGNYDLCCRQCNNFKGSRTPSELITVLETMIESLQMRVQGGAA